MTKSVHKFILKSGTAIVYGLFGFISLYLFLLSLFTTCFMVYTDEHIFYLKDFAIVMCIGLLGLCVLLAFVQNWLNKKITSNSTELRDVKEFRLYRIIAIVLTVVIATVMVIFIVKYNLPPIFDQRVVFSSAEALLEQDYSSWKMGEYFSMLPYQNGVVLMMVPFVAIFKSNALLAIQIFNIPMLFLTYFGIAKIAEIYFGKRSMYLTYIGLLLVAQMWTYVTFVYGTVPGICFSVWAIYFEMIFERTLRYRYIVASGLCLFFGIMWKSNVQIFMVAIILLLCVHAIRNKTWKPIMACAIIGAFGILQIKGITILMHAITGENTTNGIPMIAWLAMGLQESSIAPGWYNEFPMNLYRNVSTDPKVITGEVIKSFGESFALFAKEPGYMFRFFARKVASMWSDPAFQFFTIVNARNLEGVFSYEMKDLFYNGGVKHTIVYLLFDVMQSIHYFGLILFFILKRKKLKLEKSHLIVCILGGYIFHFIGEAKSQYVIPYYLLMVPYTVEGYRVMIEKLAKLEWKSKSSIKKVLYSGSGRLGTVLVVIVLVISILSGPIVTNTVKLGGQEAEYIWYCNNETQWKDSEYRKI